VFEEVVSTQER